MVGTVNILGDTRKEMWRNAVNIYAVSIEGNLKAIQKRACEISEEWFGEDEDAPDDAEQMADAALRSFDSFKSETLKLIDAGLAD